MTDSAPSSEASGQPPSKLLAWWRGRSRLERYTRHLLAIVFWFYGLCQLLVFDVDGWLIRILPNDLHWVVEYKVLVFLAIAAGIMNFVPRKIFWSWTLYILFYPLTRFFFVSLVIVYVLLKLKSWPIVFTTLNVCFAFVSSFKVNFLVYVVALIAIVAIFISKSPVNLNTSAVVLITVVMVLVVRKIIAIFRPSPVFNVYVRTMAWTMDYSRRKLLSVPDIRGRDITTLGPGVIEKRYGNLSTAVFLIELCAFLEAKFRSYQSGGLAIASYLANLAVLLFLVILLLAFSNCALYRADPANFAVSAGHGYFDFLYFTFASVFLQRVPEVVPVSVASRLIWMFATVLGVLFIAGTFLSLIFAVKRNLDDDSAARAIIKLQQERETMNRFVEEEFALPLDKAISVMEGIKSKLTSVIDLLRKARGE